MGGERLETHYCISIDPFLCLAPAAGSFFLKLAEPDQVLTACLSDCSLAQYYNWKLETEVFA
jgi:hypothetical protein